MSSQADHLSPAAPALAFTVALGQTWPRIDLRRTCDLMNKVLSHELQHTVQAKGMGLAYIPVYLFELIVVAPIATAELNLIEGKNVSFHDAHPMERQAIIWDTGKDPWR